MRKAFISNILLLLGINFLIKPFFVLGIDRSVQNIVGAEKYGLYAALMSFSYLFQIINDFGVQNYVARTIAQHRQLAGKYFVNISVFRFFLASTYTLVTFFAAILIGYGQEVWHLLFALIFNQIIVSYIFFARANLSALGFYRWDSLISALDKLLAIIFCSILLWKNPFSTPFQIEWFVYAQTLSFLLTALAASLVLVPKIRLPKFRFNKAFIYFLIKESAPYALIYFLMTFYTRLDSVMLERMLPDGKLEAGIYASAYRLLDAISVIGLLFANLLLPMFSNMLKENKSIRPLFLLSLGGLLSIAIVSSVGIFYFKETITFFLYKNATLYWSDVLGVLILSFIPISIMYILGALLTAKGAIWKMNYIFFFGVVLNFLLNYSLIPHFKAIGAAFSTLITQIYIAVALLILAFFSRKN